MVKLISAFGFDELNGHSKVTALGCAGTIDPPGGPWDAWRASRRRATVLVSGAGVPVALDDARAAMAVEVEFPSESDGPKHSFCRRGHHSERMMRRTW